jgi:hypothetical protein
LDFCIRTSLAPRHQFTPVPLDVSDCNTDNQINEDASNINDCRPCRLGDQPETLRLR